MSVATANDKNIAVLTHLGGIFFGLIPGLVVWLWNKDGNPFVGQQAREALNFQITVLIGYTAAWLLTFVLVGLALLPVIYVGNLVLCIVAAVNVSRGEDYRYPFALRLIN
ncbi:hypothetical protein GALL_379850 [mine drainage metagenome]|uniref:DUF4870 domain-containing protein n=1 Tax=mine drainage metagenome TaxID=410659 RepID=A0A1J5QA43_9ZZZZ